MQIPFFSAQGMHFLYFPALLLVYYLVCWLMVGRNPRIDGVSPQYEPPPGVSPGVAHYILTGGSDGTTLAAVLAQLAAKGVISIEPQSAAYRIRLVKEDAAVLPEEAALLKVALHAQLAVQPYAPGGSAKVGDPSPPRGATRTSAVVFGSDVAAAGAGAPLLRRDMATIEPAAQQDVKSIIDAIQSTFRQNLQDVYFRWHWWCAGLGMAATLLWSLGTAFFVPTEDAPSVFLTLWLFMFTSIAGLVLGGVMTAKPTRPTLAQRLQPIVIALLFFVLPGFLIASLAMPRAKFFVLSLLLALVLNSTFMVVMRAPTQEGRKVLAQLAGFREFLVRVEQDQLERMNTPAEKAEMMDRFLPYAIALGVKEGWGDTMASAFSNAIVER
jgi:predicted membrane protein DUF2207